MPTCWNCGEEIIFRKDESGRPTPIHLHGGWCSGASGTLQVTSPFRDIASYVNPNANCPVCGDPVFYYQSPYVGRVFFDDLGWPWPKHPCTDNPVAQAGSIRSLRNRLNPTVFKNQKGEVLRLYKIKELREDLARIRIRFVRMNGRQGFWASVSMKTLSNDGLQIDDFWRAPSFIVKKEITTRAHRRVEFISERLRKIVRLNMKRE